MKRLVELLFVRRKIIITLCVFLFGFGVYSYVSIPKQDMPKIDTPYMIIQIDAPNVSASQLNETTIQDIEQVVSTFEYVSEMDSSVYDHVAVIIITFEYQLDDPAAYSEAIYQKVMELHFVDDITNIQYTSNFEDPHIVYALYGETVSAIELEQKANEFRNHLLLISEIKEVSIDQAYQEEFLYQISQEALLINEITTGQIVEAITSNTNDIPLGGIGLDAGEITVISRPSYQTIDDIKQMTIQIEGEEYVLEDLGSFSIYNSSDKEYEFNGNRAVFISIKFHSDVDYTKLDSIMTQQVTEYNSLNTDTQIGTVLYLPTYVNDQISQVFFSLLFAIGIVLLVVMIGLGFRQSIMIIITIPLIVFGTIGVLYLSGYQLHKLTIVGLIISIGILVDNSIVITERIKFHIEEGMYKIDAAKQAILDTSGPILSSTLTTIASFIVLVLLPGFLGNVISSMPFTVIIAISLSYIISMTLSPILATILYQQHPKKRGNSIHEVRIKSMISYTLKYPYLWIVLCITAFVLSSYFAFRTLPIDLYPNDQRSVLYIDFELEDVTSEIDINQVKENIVLEIQSHPNMQNYSASIGGDLPNLHYSTKWLDESKHVGRMYINYDLSEQVLLDVQQTLQATFNTMDDANVTVHTLELSPPISPLRIILSHEQNDILTTNTEQVLKLLERNPNIEHISVSTSIQAPKLVVDYHDEAIALAGVARSEINQEIFHLLNGYQIPIEVASNQVSSLMVEQEINSVSDVLSSHLYQTETSQFIPLFQLITFTEEIDYVVMERHNQLPSTYIDIVIKDDVDVGKETLQIKDQITSVLDDDITFEILGENAMFLEIREDLIRASLIAFILIYIIMLIQFNHFIKPLVIYVSIPLSFTGSFLLLLISGQAITATSLVGMVSLIGITVNTGILLVDAISKDIAQGNDILNACVNSVYLRFRPIMLTSMTTIFGMIPLLLTGGTFFYPLALAFVGGMVSSTILTIFIIPCIYLVTQKKEDIPLNM